MVRLILVFLFGCVAVLHGQDPESPLLGKVEGNLYISATGAFKIPIPVIPELGGTVTDTENVVTFEDDFNVHVSIGAFPQDGTHRWEYKTRGPKEYLINYFKHVVLTDFQRRFDGCRVESARFLPGLHDGALLAYTLLPGGSMFADRVSITSQGMRSHVAKRGNLVFVKNEHVFVIMTELAERVLQHSTYKKTTEEEDEILRQRLLDLVGKIQFTKPIEVTQKKP